jgi:hypothetical protein
MSVQSRTMMLALALAGAVLAGQARAAEIECGTQSAHPVCKATFAAHPPGGLKTHQRSVGTAVVNGATVNYTCQPGGMGAQNAPRKCSF